jgi:hypothetical protein
MAKSTPKVQLNHLYLNGDTAPVCSIGSPEWFDWLETAAAFRYQTNQTIVLFPGYSRPMQPISLRKEKRRRGHLWYAYRRSHGVLYKRYVGKTATLTGVKLDEIATLLNEIW